jgi:hypothetical protein
MELEKSAKKVFLKGRGREGEGGGGTKAPNNVCTCE